MAPMRIEDDNVRFNNKKPRTEITISEYIFRRLAQLGVKSLFGVPGDFNLALLEHMYDDEVKNNIEWRGCCNELNAAYAADAYAKTSGQMAAILTTFGVGELSAINGIAGSYSEFVPVVHIVGTSRMADKESPKVKNIHHLIANQKMYEKPNHYTYQDVDSSFSVSTASLSSDIEESCKAIDQTLENIWKYSRPGYIFVPCDLTEMKVPVSRLMVPLELKYDITATDDKIDMVCNDILERLYHANNASILAGTFIKKMRMTKQFMTLVHKLEDKVNFFDTLMVKGIYGRNFDRYLGTYCGKAGESTVSQSIEASDLVLHIGSFSNEMNDGFFSFKLKESNLIELNPQYVKIGEKRYTDVTLMDILPRLITKLDPSKVSNAVEYHNVRKQTIANVDVSMKAPLTEKQFGEALEQLLQPNDVVVMETCSFMVPFSLLRMPGCHLVNQCFWGSIGYAIPATLGASLAMRDFHMPGKVVTIEGDGSAQMTFQELGSIMRYNVDAIMFILNNSGYTIERAIKGPNRPYNDICSNWQWTQMLKTFGDVNEQKSRSCQISSAKKLNVLAGSKEFHDEKRFQLVELMLPKFDIPRNDVSLKQ